jgi:hypothetical protein
MNCVGPILAQTSPQMEEYARARASKLAQKLLAF